MRAMGNVDGDYGARKKRRLPYRSGTRRHEVMNVIARGLSDEDITQLSAWYSAIRIDAQAPQ
jgi:cytochrome c553